VGSDFNSNMDMISKLILTTFDIMADDKRLRNSVENFEKQRGDYPMRREFSSYTVKMGSENQTLKEKLLKIGFKIKT